MKFREKIKQLFKFNPLALVITVMLIILFFLIVGEMVGYSNLILIGTPSSLEVAGGIIGLFVALIILYIFSQLLITSDHVRNFLGPSWKVALVKLIVGIVLFFLIDGISHVSYRTETPLGEGWERGFPLTHSSHDGGIHKGWKDFSKMAINLLFAYIVVCLFICGLTRVLKLTKK